MKPVTLALTVALLLSSSAAAPMLLLPVSQAQPTTLLSVDFTGSSLPQGWSLQGSAKFIGGLNSSSGIGGIQLVNNASQEGAVIYDSAFTTQNVIIEFSGMYEPGLPSLPEADDIGLGFYSSSPSAHVGPENPASVNGYYASYEFSNLLGYIGHYDLPSLMYNAQPLYIAHALFSEGRLPSSGRNYLFAETIVTPTSVSLNALTRRDSPWIQEPSISLANMLTYNNATEIDNSHSTLYVGGATFTGLPGNPWSYEYVYWLRILSYSTTPTSTISASQPSITQSLTQAVNSVQPPALSMGGAGNVLLYAVIGAIVVVTVVLVAVFLALRRRDHGGAAKSTYGASMFCKSCGSPLSGLEQFCDKCGAPQG